MIHPHNRREPNFNRRDQVLIRGRHYSVPEGWERVTRGPVLAGDQIWRLLNPTQNFAYAGPCDFGGYAQAKYCVLRKIDTAEKTEKEVPNGPEVP